MRVGCWASESKVSTAISISSSETTLAKLLGSKWSVVLSDEDDASGEGDSGKFALAPLLLLGGLDCALRWRFLLVGIFKVFSCRNQ